MESPGRRTPPVTSVQQVCRFYWNIHPGLFAGWGLSFQNILVVAEWVESIISMKLEHLCSNWQWALDGAVRMLHMWPQQSSVPVNTQVGEKHMVKLGVALDPTTKSRLSQKYSDPTHKYLKILEGGHLFFSYLSSSVFPASCYSGGLTEIKTISTNTRKNNYYFMKLIIHILGKKQLFRISYIYLTKLIARCALIRKEKSGRAYQLLTNFLREFLELISYTKIILSSTSL